MKLNKKKKAFTLTELLVVVIIIGVLSAVVLPKFNKIVETRKTTEAEELMAAVRTEQEKRCALDKNYLTDSDKLTDVLTSTNTKNFNYSLTDTGIKAESNGKYKYELQMPSYADGRICCANRTELECLKLNKDYPLCSELIAKADYDEGKACAGTTTPAVPPVIQCPGSATEKCGCNNAGERTRTCNTSTGEWSEWSACTVADECECTGTKPATSQTCNSCGTQTRTVTCNTSTGEWSAGSWSTCSKTTAECSCKATPVYSKYHSDAPPSGYDGGGEFFGDYVYIDYISGYECKDGAGNACDGCKIPSCSDPSFFNAHKQTCCKTEMKSHPSCCTTAVNVQQACGYVPQGQQCNKWTWECKNIAGESCLGCSMMMETTGDEEPLPDDYEPTPGEGTDFSDRFEDVDIDKELVLEDIPSLQL
ncbi:MAG: type II secretion system protein [Elusimicrobium sp.]|uniref:Type II secretion system protein n=1 Tax=Candidatus Avelusimicrobium gallicola TaxID=2562704 RepID=A0A928DR96_9BACT|nr:type II secretion system protein [Elusimicrobium sp.]